MTLQKSDDVVKGELSIEELEAIAAGWPHWVHSVVNFVGKELHAAEHAVVDWLKAPRLPKIPGLPFLF